MAYNGAANTLDGIIRDDIMLVNETWLRGIQIAPKKEGEIWHWKSARRRNPPPGAGCGPDKERRWIQAVNPGLALLYSIHSK